MSQNQSELIELVIEPRRRDLGGFTVGRVLPFTHKKTVGPFIFWDHMGPVEFASDQHMDVRPHPHVGLATVTFLFEGTITHRDSVGSVQDIRPGDVNWMTAGSGIVHSERSPRVAGPRKMHGLQVWVALPKAFEDTAPSFHHVGKDQLPKFRIETVEMTLIAGETHGVKSPVPTFSKMFYLAANLKKGQKLPLRFEPGEEFAIYIVDGSVKVDTQDFVGPLMVVFKPGSSVLIEASADSRIMVLGGEPCDGPREIWWNFVATSKERIESAKARWRENKFAPVPGETEFIPLPRD